MLMRSLTSTCQVHTYSLHQLYTTLLKNLNQIIITWSWQEYLELEPGALFSALISPKWRVIVIIIIIIKIIIIISFVKTWVLSYT